MKERYKQLRNISVIGPSNEGVLCIDIEYPRNEGNIQSLEIGLSDVRAADSIRVSYDFDRDGWKIEQASKFSWDNPEAPDFGDADWKEVAFIKAWARETPVGVTEEADGQ